MTAQERRSALLVKFKPGVPKRYLLLAAALAWTLAGAMLLGRGGAWLLEFGDHLLARFAIALVGGLVFFFLLFSRISLKHVARILAIEVLKPCLFSFFNLKAYAMMAFMIAGGILLRSFKLIEPSLLYTFYACMGTPLLLSAIRFYHTFVRYESP